MWPSYANEISTMAKARHFYTPFPRYKSLTHHRQRVIGCLLREHGVTVIEKTISPDDVAMPDQESFRAGNYAKVAHASRIARARSAQARFT